MTDDVFNLDDFVSQVPTVEVKKTPQEEPSKDNELLKELVDAVKAVPQQGLAGKDGKDGLDGAKGADGVGRDGKDGVSGSKGADGVSVIDAFVKDDDLFTRLSDGKLINAGNVRGPQGFQGPQGSGGKSYRGGGYKPTESNLMANSLIFVTQDNVSTTLGGVIDSSKQYVIDGIVDVTGVQIEVPATGMYLVGHNFDISQLVSSEAGATLFHSLASGNLLMLDLGITMSGTGSQVYDLVSNTGFEAVEIQRINYNNCTSLGTLDNFRQGLETGTGRFGGTPELTLKGTWVGGFYITTSIIRGLTAGSYSLFKAGVGFTMASRFFSDMNVDLPAGVSYLDFAPANFINDNTLQLEDGIVTRAGVLNPSDALFTPNINHFDLESKWKNNVGLTNTRVGGALASADSVAVPITTVGVSVEPTGTLWIPFFVEHFSEVSNGRLKHLGTSPTQFRVFVDLVVESQSNNEIRLELWKYTASTMSDAVQYAPTRQINALQGGRDVAFFSFTTFLSLEKDDVFYIKLANLTSTQNVTVEADGTLILEAR